MHRLLAVCPFSGYSSSFCFMKETMTPVVIRKSYLSNCQKTFVTATCRNYTFQHNSWTVASFTVLYSCILNVFDMVTDAAEGEITVVTSESQGMLTCCDQWFKLVLVDEVKMWNTFPSFSYFFFRFVFLSFFPDIHFLKNSLDLVCEWNVWFHPVSST